MCFGEIALSLDKNKKLILLIKISFKHIFLMSNHQKEDMHKHQESTEKKALNKAEFNF